MSSNYENQFEQLADTSIVISDLIEQLFLVEEVIQRHREDGNSPGLLKQYLQRKEGFRQQLNALLSPVRMEVVEREAA